MIPTATYRLQFHQGFTFRDGHNLVPYLAELGISHVYASPFFRAEPGSLHGYDICDHNELNPEVGSREELEAFSAALKQHGMGLIVDFVPNHMGIGESHNRWWSDVLENGPASTFAHFFDINWQPLKRELENKVLLPILGAQYGRELEDGKLTVEFADGAFFLNYHAWHLPLEPCSTGGILQRAAARLQPAPAELDSIVTAIIHLPPPTEVSPEKKVERARETTIVRERLARLCTEDPAVAAAISAEVEEFHTPAVAERFDRLDALLSAQPYRLSFWRVAAEEINYRRFFDVNSLAAIRMELPEVFIATHRMLSDLIAAGLVSGVRIDHIDGLARPKEYLEALQSLAAQASGSQGGPKEVYVVVEKILGGGELLRSDWPIHGTTGYEFANDATTLQVDATNEPAITDCYDRFIGFHLNIREVVYRSKRLVMQVAMASEINVLGHLLNRLSESNRWYRDFTINALTTAIREVIACFPVYRTYLMPESAPHEADIRIIKQALSIARRRNPALERTVFDFLRDVLIPPENNPHPVAEELRREFVLKFQQCTGPIAAKGVEDTAFYVDNRLVALNEVGSEPGTFGLSIEAFHRKNAMRLSAFPHSQVATSTHDTKRSEDVRARIVGLSELPHQWARTVRRWRTTNRKHKQQVDGEPAPDANEEFLLYQTLLGAWPLTPLTEQSRPAFVKRIQD
jgi:(1->4)-alpha-D-glucan 1-alpha-D-glucosylmutase